MVNSTNREAIITINGQQLNEAQSMTIRVAVANMLVELSDLDCIFMQGPTGPLYKLRLREIERLLVS